MRLRALGKSHTLAGCLPSAATTAHAVFRLPCAAIQKLVSRPMSVRGRLLLSVDLVLGVLLIALAFVGYQRGLDAAVDDRRAALAEEAAAIHGAVVHLRHGHGRNAVQSYVDEVCRRRCERASPWHRIEVEWSGSVLRTTPDGPTSKAFSEALRLAAASPHGRSRFRDRNFAVGNAHGEGTSVYVAEATDEIRHAVRSDVLRGLAVLTTLGLVAAGIVNIVVVAVVVRPIERLAVAVGEIGNGRPGYSVEARESHETHLLAQAINRMSESLAKANRERRVQMEKARRLQEHLLPTGASLWGLEYSYLFQPADEVGGDYFDILPLPDGDVLICIADVTGHGVPAALEAAMLKTLLAQAVEQFDRRPGATLEFVNRRFAAVLLPGNFASAFLARWRPKSRTLEYASAGHESGLLIRRDQSFAELRSTGPLLGIIEHAEWETHTVFVNDGERLVLCTDGLVEAADEFQELFGRIRLQQLVSTADLRLDELVGQLEQEIEPTAGRFKASDDVTVLAIEFGNAVPVSLPMSKSRAS